MQEPESDWGLRTEKAVSGQSGSRGLGTLTPVGLDQAIVTTLGCKHVGAPSPAVESQRPSLPLEGLEGFKEAGGIPLFPVLGDTSDCLSLFRIPPPHAGSCLLKLTSFIWPVKSSINTQISLPISVISTFSAPLLHVDFIWKEKKELRGPEGQWRGDARGMVGSWAQGEGP